MKRGRSSKKKYPTMAEIDIFCQSTDEIIARIYERCEAKKAKKRKKTELINDKTKILEEVA